MSPQVPVILLAQTEIGFNTFLFLGIRISQFHIDEVSAEFALTTWITSFTICSCAQPTETFARTKEKPNLAVKY